jgi:hypothetical protein
LIFANRGKGQTLILNYAALLFGRITVNFSSSVLEQTINVERVKMTEIDKLAL